MMLGMKRAVPVVGGLARWDFGVGTEADGGGGQHTDWVESLELFLEGSHLSLRIGQVDEEKHDGPSDCTNWQIDIEAPSPCHVRSESLHASGVSPHTVIQHNA